MFKPVERLCLVVHSFVAQGYTVQECDATKASCMILRWAHKIHALPGQHCVLLTS
jgi:hypothetical protein